MANQDPEFRCSRCLEVIQAFGDGGYSHRRSIFVYFVDDDITLTAAPTFRSLSPWRIICPMGPNDLSYYEERE